MFWQSKKIVCYQTFRASLNLRQLSAKSVIAGLIVLLIIVTF